MNFGRRNCCGWECEHAENMTHVTMSDYIICNEHIMKTSSTCVFLVKSEGDNTNFSLLSLVLVTNTSWRPSPNYHGEIVLLAGVSWLYCVFVLIHMSTITIVPFPLQDALVVLAPSTSGHCFQTWWRGHFSCKPHGHNSHYDQWFVKYCNVKFIPRGSHNWISLQRFS